MSTAFFKAALLITAAVIIMMANMSFAHQIDMRSRKPITIGKLGANRLKVIACKLGLALQTGFFQQKRFPSKKGAGQQKTHRPSKINFQQKGARQSKRGTIN